MASRNDLQPNTTSTTPAEQSDLLSQDVVAWIPPPPFPPSTNVEKLIKPVVIPRVDTSGLFSAKLPFVRAYSPSLRPHGINEAEFLAFVDTLAVCQAAPLPLQALDKVGAVVGAVPYHWAMAASAGMSVAAGVGTAAATIIRTRRFLEKVNREFFGPRRLKAEICKTGELIAKLGCGPITVDSVLGGALRSEDQESSLRDRYMQVLTPYISPLTLDVPPPSQQRRFVDEMSAKAIERRLRKRENRQKKKLEKASRKQTKGPAHEAGVSDSSYSFSSGDDSDAIRSPRGVEEGVLTDEKIRKIELKAERKMTQAGAQDAAKIMEKKEKKIEKRERDIGRGAEKDSQKAAGKLAKAFMKDEKKSDKRNRREKEKVASMEFLIVEKLYSSP